MRILHDSKSSIYKRPFGPLRKNEEGYVGLHIPKSCLTLTAELIVLTHSKEEYKRFSLTKENEYDGYEVFSAPFTLDKCGLYFYYFYIVTKNEKFALYKEGYDMTNIAVGELWQISCIPEDYKVPNAFLGNIMYQIFPDRFNESGKCNLSQKLIPYYVHQNKSDVPDYLPDSSGKVRNMDFYGGNLKGIEEKLPYISKLGVSVIYLNPIFKAYSNHRYDTADYTKIDEMLGTDEDFESLCKSAHSYGIKIILDGVFSHTGENSVYFDKFDVFKNGAYKNPSSPYRSWFKFKENGEYECWWGIKCLPCTDEENQEFQKHIFSAVKKWLLLGADGLRLDVADELPDSFIWNLRCHIKSIKPDSLLLGEVWEDASNKSSYGQLRKYFTGGELDGVMNYPARNAIIDFVKGNDCGKRLRNTIMTLAENYPYDALLASMTMLSTHDTVRILSLLSPSKQPDTKEKRALYKMPQSDYEIASKRLLLATAMQFLMPGIASVFYGDELGTEGFEDPFCRSYMNWEKENTSEFLPFFISLGKFKNENVALQKGTVHITLPQKNVVCIERKYGENHVIGYFSTADEFFLPNGYVPCISKDFTSNKISKYGFVILKK